MRETKKPASLFHKPSGQARVRIDGHDHYLGEYRSPASIEKYEDLVTAWLRKQEFECYRLTIDELVLLYLDFAAGYYTKDGGPSNEVTMIRSAVRPLVKLHGNRRNAF